MAEASNKDPERPKRIKTSAEDLAKHCNGQQKHYATKAQEFGYARDVFNNIASQIGDVSDDPVLAPAETALNKFKNFMQVRESQIELGPFDVSSASYAIGTSVTAAVSVAGLQDVRSAFTTVQLPKQPPFWEPNRTNQYAVRLTKLDAELGKLLRSVWSSFYGGIDNPERTALLSMRQLFDHFFSIIAPDDEVRNSKYFTIKAGPKLDQVHRKERLKYAANTKINDRQWAETLESNADSVLENYDRLNELHKHGPIDREASLKVLTAMQSSLEQWIDALNL